MGVHTLRDVPLGCINHRLALDIPFVMLAPLTLWRLPGVLMRLRQGRRHMGGLRRQGSCLMDLSVNLALILTVILTLTRTPNQDPGVVRWGSVQPHPRQGGGGGAVRPRAYGKRC